MKSRDDEYRDTVAIFGAGIIGQAIYALLKKDSDVCCFFDNAAAGGAAFDGVPVVPFSRDVEFDRVYIAVMSGDALDGIRRQLLGESVPPVKIRSYKEVLLYRARVEFLHGYAEQLRSRGERCAHAEVGCYQGDFAKEINAAFPEEKLYLFDTFQGFAGADIHADAADRTVLEAFSREFSRTSVRTVLGKMPHPGSVVIKQGYFPETALVANDLQGGGREDIRGNSFGFVSVDTDLYSPTKAALEIFFPLLNDKGVVCVHDYYNEMLPGVRKAVDEFAAHNNARFFPIGDAMSIAVIK